MKSQLMSKVGIGITALATLAGPAIAQNDLAHTNLPERPHGIGAVVKLPAPVTIRSVDDFVSRWNPNNPLYVDTQDPMQYAGLRSWIVEHNKMNDSNWSVIIVDHRDRNPRAVSNGEADEFIRELQNEFTSRGEFYELRSEKSGDRNGALLFVSLDPRGNNRALQLCTQSAYDGRGIGESSAFFKEEVFPQAVARIRDRGDVIGAVKNIISSMDNARELSENYQPNWILIGGIVGAVIVGGVVVGVMCDKSGRNRCYGYSGSSSTDSYTSYDSCLSSSGGDFGGGHF